MKSLLAVAGLFCMTHAYAACSVNDAAGNHFTLENPARRIIVLAPDLVENIFAIDAGGAIAGVVDGSDYPAAARRIERVGSYSGIDLERILALHPDLIISWQYGFPRQLQALKRLGIPVFVTAPRKLEDVSRLLLQLGCLTGKRQAASAAAARFDAELAKIKSEYSATRPLKVFFQIDDKALITINKDSWINEALQFCGGVNVFAGASVIAPVISREAVIAANPDVIMHPGSNPDWQQSWQAWPTIHAVQNHKLYDIEPDWIARASPRLVKGVRQICAYLSDASSA
jgi:iron complex transport system substrate-binding protein